MKICIPTIEQKPTLNSKVARCPIAAKGFIFYNTLNQTEISLSKSMLNSSSTAELVQVLNQKYQINSFVANSYCKEIYEESLSRKFDLWLCNSLTAGDAINIFRMGGTFLFNSKQFHEPNPRFNSKQCHH